MKHGSEYSKSLSLLLLRAVMSFGVSSVLFGSFIFGSILGWDNNNSMRLCESANSATRCKGVIPRKIYVQYLCKKIIYIHNLLKKNISAAR